MPINTQAHSPIIPMDHVDKPFDNKADVADVVAAYRLVLGRNPEKSGYEHHKKAVENGTLTLDHLFEQVMNSAEFKQRIAKKGGYDLSGFSPSGLRFPDIPDGHLYLPLFQPWHAWAKIPAHYSQFKSHSLISDDRFWVLYTLARQAIHLGGEFWECGVYRGGSAALLAELLKRETAGSLPILRLFDTFAGMPPTDLEKDKHKEKDFNDTSLEAVQKIVPPSKSIHYHPGFIPDTFSGLDGSRIAFAHVDVDIYRSIHDCCKFIFPRLLVGGFMVFDDYGFPSCPGARKAVDEFFSLTKSVPLVLSTGQAVVFKSLPA